MDPSSLRDNFNNQIKTTSEQIVQLEEQLEKLKEYKLKLVGGLETLDLLEQSEETTEE